MARKKTLSCRTYRYATKRAAKERAKLMRALSRGIKGAKTSIQRKRKPLKTIYVVRACAPRG